MRDVIEEGGIATNEAPIHEWGRGGYFIQKEQVKKKSFSDVFSGGGRWGRREFHSYDTCLPAGGGTATI